MQVEVHHFDHRNNKLVHVANIEYTGLDEVNALDYAWRWSNNIDGLWSRGQLIPSIDGRLLEDNTDYNPNTTVLVELPTHMGKEIGLRSSMVGDVFKVNGKAFRVSSFGFDEIQDLERYETAADQYFYDRAQEQ